MAPAQKIFNKITFLFLQCILCVLWALFKFLLKFTAVKH